MKPPDGSFFALLAVLASTTLYHINGQAQAFYAEYYVPFNFKSPAFSGRAHQAPSQMAQLAEARSDAAEKEAQAKAATQMDFKHVHAEKVSLVYNVSQVQMEIIVKKTDKYYCYKYGELHALCSLKRNRPGMQYYRRGLNITQMEFIMLYVTAVRHRLLSGREKNKFGYLPQPKWMYKIQWSQELQVFAQRISNQCRGKLNSSLIMKTDSFRSLTTNIAITADTTSDPRWTVALSSWYSSIHKVPLDAIYRPGMGMDPYTAMAWGRSGYMGCGYTACRGNTKDQRVKIYTCVFGPGGNKPGKPIYPPMETTKGPGTLGTSVSPTTPTDATSPGEPIPSITSTPIPSNDSTMAPNTTPEGTLTPGPNFTKAVSPTAGTDITPGDTEPPTSFTEPSETNGTGTIKPGDNDIEIVYIGGATVDTNLSTVTIEPTTISSVEPPETNGTTSGGTNATEPVSPPTGTSETPDPSNNTDLTEKPPKLSNVTSSTPAPEVNMTETLPRPTGTTLDPTITTATTEESSEPPTSQTKETTNWTQVPTTPTTNQGTAIVSPKPTVPEPGASSETSTVLVGTLTTSGSEPPPTYTIPYWGTDIAPVTVTTTEPSAPSQATLPEPIPTDPSVPKMPSEEPKTPDPSMTSATQSPTATKTRSTTPQMPTQTTECPDPWDYGECPPEPSVPPPRPGFTNPWPHLGVVDIPRVVYPRG